MTICYSSLRAFRTSQPPIHLPTRPTQTCFLLSPRFAQPPPSTASSSFRFHPHQQGGEIQPAPPCPGNISALGSWHRTFRETAVGEKREGKGKRRGSLLGIPRRNALRLQRHARSSLSVHMGGIARSWMVCRPQKSQSRVERHREFLCIAEAWGKRKYERG